MVQMVTQTEFAKWCEWCSSFEDGELEPELVVRKFRTTTQHGAIEGKTQSHEVIFYNLDMIISVGYRVNSKRGVQFRRHKLS